MVELDDAVAALSRIDWDFPGTGTSQKSVHTAHWFPGNFIPQIPAALIQILSQPGNLVLDQFGGGGTTGLEAARLMRRSVVSDRLSACVLIARGKVAASKGLGVPTLRRLMDLLTWEHQCRSTEIGMSGEGGSPELGRWFESETLAQLRYLWHLVEAESEPLRHVLALLFSDVLFTCSSPGPALTATGLRRRHHWGWVADNVRPVPLRPHNAIAAFRHRLAALAETEVVKSGFTSSVIQQDARRLALADACVDLVVTSPPYVGVIDYARANRLLYEWMGWSLHRERGQEIGARYRRERRSMVDEYAAEMAECWSEMARVLKPGAYCAIVIGESRKFPGTVDAVIGRLSEVLRLVWGPVSRTPTRRRVSDRNASQPTERIFVFRKPCS